MGDNLDGKMLYSSPPLISPQDRPTKGHFSYQARFQTHWDS